MGNELRIIRTKLYRDDIYYTLGLLTQDGYTEPFRFYEESIGELKQRIEEAFQKPIVDSNIRRFSA